MLYMYYEDDEFREYPLLSDEDFWYMCWEASQRAEIFQKDVVVTSGQSDRAIITAKKTGAVMYGNGGKPIDITKVRWLRVHNQ